MHDQRETQRVFGRRYGRLCTLFTLRDDVDCIAAESDDLPTAKLIIIQWREMDFANGQKANKQ